MSSVRLGFVGKESRSDPWCNISTLLNVPGGTQGPTMTSRSLPCPCSAITKDWAGGGDREGVGSPGIKDQGAGQGRDVCGG